MKKLTIITLVMIMLIVSAVPALAAGGPPAKRGSANGNCYGNQTGYGIRSPFALSGTITAINDSSVTVSVACSNRLANPYIGQEITLSTNDITRYLLRNADGAATPISLSDLATGQKISSHGSIVDGVWTASRITVGALLNCLP